eukprot:7098813-Pyramimonas_sp.AAC.1
MPFWQRIAVGRGVEFTLFGRVPPVSLRHLSFNVISTYRADQASQADKTDTDHLKFVGDHERVAS